jgi:3-deoxy-D-manno-octulosonic-acid transferase
VPLARRSLGERPQAGGVWLADTLGELGLWYRLSGIALMGRSLIAPGGGQNPLEPARLGCAVASGPFMANFREPAHVLKEAGAIVTLTDAAAIARWVATMLADPCLRRTLGQRAATAVMGNDTLVQRTAEMVLDLLPPAAA